MGGFQFGNAAFPEVGRHPQLWMPDWEVTEMRKLRMARAGLGQPPDSELRQRLATQLAVTSALRSAAPGDAVDAVLEQICLGLEWDLGVVWIEDAVSRELVPARCWPPRGTRLSASTRPVTSRHSTGRPRRCSDTCGRRGSAATSSSC